MLAAEHGARVVSESKLLPEFGPVMGKGDAMWGGRSALRAATSWPTSTGDTLDFQGQGCDAGLLGPLLIRDDVRS